MTLNLGEFDQTNGLVFFYESLYFCLFRFEISISTSIFPWIFKKSRSQDTVEVLDVTQMHLLKLFLCKFDLHHELRFNFHYKLQLVASVSSPAAYLLSLEALDSF